MKTGIIYCLPPKNTGFSARDGTKSWRDPILTTAGIFDWTARILPCAGLRKAHRTDRHPQHKIRRTRALEDELIVAQKSGAGLPVEGAALEARSYRQGPMLSIHEQVA